MHSSTHNITSRPLKIAFLVEYGDKKNLLKALSIKSMLWGGFYNPIIPVYKRLPSKYRGISGYKNNKDNYITKGYIEAYDPDYVINLSSVSDNGFGANNRRYIKESDIFNVGAISTSRGYNGEVNYGISIFEVLDYFEGKEFKYKRNIPLDVTDINFTTRNELFFSSVFGKYSQANRDMFTKRYANTINIKKLDVSLKNYIDTWENTSLTVNEAVNLYFEIYGNNRTTDSYIFLLDISSWQDIVDLNCLQAAGFRVLPIPINICETQAAIDLSKAFIKRNYRKFNDNGVFFHTGILKSRDCDEKVFEDFAQSTYVPATEPNQFTASKQNWFPRIWESWGRQSDNAGVVKLEHSEASHDVSGTTDITLPKLLPDLIKDSDFWWRPKYANDISFSVYGADDYVATVFPTNIERADRVLGRFDLDEWRFSKNGITFTPTHKRGNISFHIPSAEKVYEAWLEAQGIKATISNPGKLAKQIVLKLGVDHTGLLAFEDFAKLIQRLTGTKGRVNSVNSQAIKGAIKKFTKDTIWYDAEGFFQWVLHKGIFELGVDITCENCGSKSWHKLNDLDNQITCNICFEVINVGQGDPTKDITWSYKPTGPFAIPDLASGAYTVVLALHFFTEVLGLKITPRYSFSSVDNTFEADFGALAAPSWREGNGILQIVGECKSFGLEGKQQFEQKEVKKLELLANKNSNSIIVFATLARKLHPKDKKLLKKLALRLRAAKLKTSSPPELLVLTGNELFTHKDLKDSWGKLSKRHKSFSGQAHRYSSLEMCDLTQQLYLDMESLADFQTRAFKIVQKEVTKI